MKHHEVIVVGGGVVGAAITLGLYRAGVDVALVERGARPPVFDQSNYDLRVYAVSPSSEQLLKDLGVWDAIVQRRVSAYRNMQVWDDLPHKPLIFSAGDLGLHRLGHIVESSLLLDALWSALGDVPCYLNTELTGFGSDEEAASLNLASGETLKARLVIAAEGKESPLREWGGIDCVRWEYPQQAVVCNVVTEQPHRDTAWQRFLPDGPLAFLPLADGRSSIVWSSTDAQTLLALSDAEFCKRLSEAIHYQLGDVLSCTRRMGFAIGLLHARDMVRPRLALAGDAAHVVHPLAGQGVNLGLSDAAALIAELTSTLALKRDPGNLRVLKRYERARKAETLDMLAVTDGLYRAYGMRLGGWDDLRNLGLSAVNRLAPVKNVLMRRALGV
jgi:2-octaprenylphenol hydroxylase